MRTGKRIYFEINTGNVIVDTGEYQGFVLPTTVDQDIFNFKTLSERNRETFDYIELEFGQYAQDFAECNGYRVNPETKTLEFSYPDPNETELTEPVYRKPLTEEVQELQNKNLILTEEIETVKQVNLANMLAMTDMFESQLITEKNNLDTMLAVTELYEVVMGGS